MTEDHVLWGLVAVIVLALLAWLIVGVSAGTTYNRNFEAACAAAGGRMQNMGAGGDACFKVTYETIPLRDVRKTP